MINQRVYIRATTRKQQNQQIDDFYGEQQYDDIEQYDSLLYKRTQKEYLNEEFKSKKTLHHFDISNQQWNIVFQQNPQTQLTEENIISSEQEIEQNNYEKQKVFQLFKIEDFSVLEINEINYIEQLQVQKDYQMVGKKHKQNISKKIYKFVC